MHLTNYAINRFNKNFIANNSEDIYNGLGSKRHLSWFKQFLDQNGFCSLKIFGEIDEIIVKTLLTVQQSLLHL